MWKDKGLQLVMLPTTNSSNLGLYIDTKNIVLRKQSDIPRGESQHLYLLSDEKIKEGDWGIEFNGVTLSSVFQYSGRNRTSYNDSDITILFDIDGNQHHLDNCKKIIATTDKSLVIKDHQAWAKCLPQPSVEFLEEYVKRCNSKKSLEVEVEYEEWHKAKLPINFLDYIEPGSGMPIIAGTEETYYKLKKNRGNTISIRFKEEKKYSRGEVEELCGKAFDAGEAYRTGSCEGFKQIHPNKYEWIKENLK